MKSILYLLLYIFFSIELFSQSGLDSLAYEDSADMNYEYLFEQLAEEDDTDMLDIFENEKLVEASKKFWNFPSVSIRSRLSKKLQIAKGYKTGKYLGTPIKSYQRIKANQGEKYSGGILFEKDAGERYLSDFTNGFIQIRDIGFITSIIAGDFYIEAGQGLVLWRGYDFQKGANILAGTLRDGKGLKPHLSSDENGYLRGVGVNMNVRNVDVTLFFSNKRLSASINDSNQITSIYTVGYYRTESEISKLNKVNEMIAGGRALYDDHKIVKLGLTLLYSKYSKPLVMDKKKGFYEDIYSVFGFDYFLKFKILNTFGEISLNPSKKYSGLGGIYIFPDKMLKLIMLYRHYPSNNFKRYSNPFGESYGGENEEGFYTGLEFKPLKGLTLTGYFDQFKFPEKTSIIFPRGGSEYFLQSEYKLSKKVFLSIRYRNKITDVKEKILDNINREVSVVGSRLKRNIRLTVDYKLSEYFKMRSRFEYLNLQNEIVKNRERGMMLYQDIQFRNSENLSVYFRINYFTTDSYFSAIYQYENDLPGILSVPPLYGRGIKWYCMINYMIIKSVKVSVKYSYLVREDVKKISSGWDELPGNYDSRFGFQMDIKF